MRQEKGLTIVQLMLVLAVAGIAGWFVVDVLIDKRCEQNPANAICADRADAGLGNAMALVEASSTSQVALRRHQDEYQDELRA